MIRGYKRRPGLELITLLGRIWRFVISSNSAIGVLHISKDLLSISSHRTATRGIVEPCLKSVLLLTLPWCWTATSCHPVAVAVLANYLSFLWKNGLLRFLLQAIRWPMVF